MTHEISISQSEYRELQKWRKVRPQLANLFEPRHGRPNNGEIDSEFLENDEAVKRIRKYISDNEDEKLNKEKVVLAFKGVYSRKKVFKCIKFLTNFSYVNARRDPQTRRDYILTINKESLLNSLMSELDEMENVYFTILDKLQSMKKGQHISDISFVSMLYITFRHTVDEYFYRILIDWPEKTIDVLILQRAQKIFFLTASRILSGIQKLIAKIGDGATHAKNLTQLNMKYVLSPTILAPHFIRRMISLAKRLTLYDDVSCLLDFTWTTVSKTHSARSWPLDALLPPSKDWREYLSQRFQNYPVERKIISSF